MLDHLLKGIVHIFKERLIKRDLVVDQFCTMKRVFFDDVEIKFPKQSL